MLKMKVGFEYAMALVGSLIKKEMECTSGAGNAFVVFFLDCCFQ